MQGATGRCTTQCVNGKGEIYSILDWYSLLENCSDLYEPHQLLTSILTDPTYPTLDPYLNLVVQTSVEYNDGKTVKLLVT